MARGTIAKERVEKKIAEAFGEDWIGIHDKKLYIWANDGGERVQIAISLTCPKTPIQVENGNTDANGDWDFSDTPKMNVAVSAAEPAEITEEEVENLQKLLEKLGL